jgi:C1A family cysteine protease
MSVTIDVDLRDKLDCARDQGSRPTCMVFAVSAAHEFKRGASEYLSAEYLFYSGAQRTHKDPKQGLTRNAVRDALRHDGQPLETAWPYLEAPPDAADWKPPVTVQVTHKVTIEFAARTVAEVRAIVKSGTPVTLVVMATLAMYTPDAHGVVRACVGDKVTSRHALLAVGSGHADDGEYLLVRNSWGQSWGQAGHGWLHDPYLAPQLEISGMIT